MAHAAARTAVLDGFVVGITADRRWEEQAELLARRGASVVHGPAIRTLPLASDDELHAVTEQLIAEPPDVVVANTAIGMRAWLAEAESHGLGDALTAALDAAWVAARGPKVAGALHSAAIGVDFRAPTETLAELCDVLLARGVAGSRIAFQHDGAVSSPVVDELRRAGADVVDVPVYRWQLPADAQPALRLVQQAVERRLHAVTFTCGPAVRNLFALAEEAGQADELRAAFDDGVAAVCVGPVCERAARRHGVRTPVTPARARLGPMVRALADHLEARVIETAVDGVRIVVRGTVVEGAGQRSELSGTELRLLDALLERPGAVVSKRDLLSRVWGDPAGDPHVVEVTVGRLRPRLGPVGVQVVTVPRRGYRLTAAAP